MHMTPERLTLAVGCSLANALRYAPALTVAVGRYGINTPRRIAAFLGQAAVESACFTAVEEHLFYSTAMSLVAVWPQRFRIPLLGESLDDMFDDGMHNATFYTGAPAKLAELVYGGRLGNGPVGTGDGYKYRGRGLFQLTGREAYRAASAGLGLPLLSEPDLLLRPGHAVNSAAWFWDNVCGNYHADRNDLAALTRAVTGGHTDLAKRMEYTQRAYAIYSASEGAAP
jgi:putative chitinase